MLAAKAEAPQMTEAAHRASFFRQSGWLMIANVAGGALMWAVHFLNRALPSGEYGLFVAYLAIVMSIPTIPLQMAMAHQTARALAVNRRGELAGMIRLLWFGTLLLWLAGAVGVWIFRQPILQHWKLNDLTGIWLTMGAVLLSLWLPMFWGMLQGQQSFLSWGWSMIVNAIGRFGLAVIVVFAIRNRASQPEFGAYAAGLTLAVVFGLTVAVAVAAWPTRSLWLRHSLPFDWSDLLKEVIPLMLGFAAFQFLFTADTMFVTSYFTHEQVDSYGGAGTLSRALIWLVGPLAAVMFPRIVHSEAKAQKTDLMGLVLIGTAVLAIAGALSLFVLGPWVVKLVFKPQLVKVVSTILPWYAFAMVPLAVSNVLLNNLLARSSYKIVLPLIILAAGYAFALTRFHETLVTVLKTLGTFNLLLFLICAWFTWGRKVQSP